MDGSSGETRSRQPLHTGLQGEYAAGLRLLGEFLFRQMQPGRGDIESIEIVAAEGAAGDATRGNGDDGVYGAVGRKADQRTAFPSRVPDVSLRIDRRAVGEAETIRIGEDPFVRDRAELEVEIVGVDGAGQGIGEIHRPMIGAPAGRVRDADAAFHRYDPQVRLYLVEYACRLLDVHVRAVGRDIVLHRAEPEPALAVDAAVIGPIPRSVRLGRGDPHQLRVARIEHVQAVVRGD